MPNHDEIQLLSSDDSESEEATLTKKHRVELPPFGEGGMEGENPDEIAISPSDSDEERTPVNRPGGDSLQGSGMEGSGDSLQGSGVEGGGDSLQGSEMEGGGDSLQGSGMESGGHSLQGSEMEGGGDNLQGSGMEGSGDNLQGSGMGRW